MDARFSVNLKYYKVDFYYRWRMSGTLKWIGASLLLFAPVFACIDVALADYGGGVMVADAWKLYNNVYWMRFEGKVIDKVRMLTPRYWIIPAVAFIISFMMSTAPEPHPLKDSEEDVLVTLLVLGAIGLIIFIPTFIILYGTPTLISFLRNEWFQNGFGRAVLDVTEMSCVYSMVSLHGIMHFLLERTGGNPILDLLAIFGPFLVIPPLASTAGALTGGIIGDRRYEEKRVRRKIEWERQFGYLHYGSSRFQTQTAGLSHSYMKREAEAKARSAPDVSVFTNHIRRSVENAKKGKGKVEKKSAGNVQEFKRRVKEKDRTWYIA